MTETEPATDARRSGPGRVLITIYGIFAVAATSRALAQIAQDFDKAPLAYLLSGLAGLIYIVATVTLARAGRPSHRIAVASCSVELTGVVVVGALSLFDQSAFPATTVWSGFGYQYGLVPLILPILGLAWLRRTARDLPPRSV